jgi:hypothetical protein
MFIGEKTHTHPHVFFPEELGSWAFFFNLWFFLNGHMHPHKVRKTHTESQVLWGFFGKTGLMPSHVYIFFAHVRPGVRPLRFCAKTAGSPTGNSPRASAPLPLSAPLYTAPHPPPRTPAAQIFVSPALILAVRPSRSTLFVGDEASQSGDSEQLSGYVR